MVISWPDLWFSNLYLAPVFTFENVIFEELKMCDEQDQSHRTSGNCKMLHNVLFGWTETGRVGLPLTSSLPVSSSLLPISCCRPRMPMTAASSGGLGNEEGFSDMTARRKLAASVALGKQVEGRRAHGLLSTWRKRRELERQNTTHVTFL